MLNKSTRVGIRVFILKVGDGRRTFETRTFMTNDSVVTHARDHVILHHSMVNQ